MGVDFGDVDNDGDADLIVTNFFAETNTLYRNDGNGGFTDHTVLAGLASPTLHSVGFGTRFFDYDNTTGTWTSSSPTGMYIPTFHSFPQGVPISSPINFSGTGGWELPGCLGAVGAGTAH